MHSLHIVRSLKMCIWVLIFLEVIMVVLRNIADYFSKTEITLWFSSVILIIVSFAVFDGENYMTLLASLISKVNNVATVVIWPFLTIKGVESPVCIVPS